MVITGEEHLRLLTYLRNGDTWLDYKSGTYKRGHTPQVIEMFSQTSYQKQIAGTDRIPIGTEATSSPQEMEVDPEEQTVNTVLAQAFRERYQRTDRAESVETEVTADEGTTPEHDFPVATDYKYGNLPVGGKGTREHPPRPIVPKRAMSKPRH